MNIFLISKVSSVALSTGAKCYLSITGLLLQINKRKVLKFIKEKDKFFSVNKFKRQLYSVGI